jgi:hypothetical protein
MQAVILIMVPQAAGVLAVLDLDHLLVLDRLIQLLEHPSHMQLVVLVEYQVLVMELLILAMVVKVIHRMYLHLQVAQAVQAM